MKKITHSEIITNKQKRLTPPAMSLEKVFYDLSPFTDYDINLFKGGYHYHLYKKLGAHQMVREGVPGTYFAVWAPNAQSVSVIGNFNGWNRQSHPLGVRWDSSGIWEGFIPSLGKGEIYKYYVISKYNNFCVDKMDPFAFYCEIPPKTASIVWDLEYLWNDQGWMTDRHLKNSLNGPMSIYEVHLGSWRRMVEEENRFLTYRELANYLVDYVKKMGFTHVELMPILEHPFYGSWGYQTLGYFASTNRYGSPQDFMYMVDCFHQNDIGVILDWVPSHFPSDEHGLAWFDGTSLYEHQDPQKGFHPDWKSYIFNYGRNEIKEFLISSALFWFEHYHIDGLRVDGVASMLYLDYSRNEGEWIPNIYGGRENIEAIALLKELNETIYKEFPGVQMFAEESTAWTKVSRPTYDGGLGFGMKWNMGWMHDTLQYFSKDPIYRKYHQNDLTFSMLYAFTENFVLSLSHDEVVHGKGSLLGRMPGDLWQQFANLRLLYAYMYGHPGKKLLFMGGEFGQWREWNHEESLDWHLLKYDTHKGVQKLLKDINHLYRQEPALYQHDFDQTGFEWIDCSDWQQSILSFIRKTHNDDDAICVVCNFTPTPRYNYRIGVPFAGWWKEIINSDASMYGGNGIGNLGGKYSEITPYHGKPYSLSLNLPPLGVVYLKKEK